jgi:hypothetical protein
VSRSRAWADLREPTPLLDRVPGRSWPLWTRPLGYGALTIVWLALAVLVVIVAFVALPLALSSNLHGGPLTDLPLFRRSDWVATLVVIIVIAAPILGVISLLLVAATLGMLLSAATLFTRSLRPRYADEQLSLSLRSRGETVGPVTTAVTGTSVALVPIRMTRWTKIVTIVRFFGWIPNPALFLLGTAWGIAFMGTVGWVLWPARGTASVVCGVASGIAGLGILALAWRLRRRLPRIMPSELAGTAYERSWPNRVTPRGGAGSGGRRRPRPRRHDDRRRPPAR